MNLAPHAPQPVASKDEFSPEESEFVRWLFDRGGLDVRHYRTETLRRRYSACLRMLRAADPEQAYRRLERAPDLIPAAMGMLVIGVTSFFRDHAVFDQLSDHILPALSSDTGHPRIWSLGCSDGEELYSTAILLAQLGKLNGAHLLGTDCRAPAIARARDGTYAAAMLRDLPPQCVETHFERVGDTHFRVAAALRHATHWRVADVNQVLEPGGWDLILCRNMAMYFLSEVAGRLWTQLATMLRPGGFLVLGKAERPYSAKRMTQVGPCIYRKG